jgi:hypothetical protein
MLLQSLRALCQALAGAGRIRKYLEELARAIAVPGRFEYGFRTELHFADAQRQIAEATRPGEYSQLRLTAAATIPS